MIFSIKGFNHDENTPIPRNLPLIPVNFLAVFPIAFLISPKSSGGMALAKESSRFPGIPFLPAAARAFAKSSTRL